MWFWLWIRLTGSTRLARCAASRRRGGRPWSRRRRWWNWSGRISLPQSLYQHQRIILHGGDKVDAYTFSGIRIYTFSAGPLLFNSMWLVEDSLELLVLSAAEICVIRWGPWFFNNSCLRTYLTLVCTPICNQILKLTSIWKGADELLWASRRSWPSTNGSVEPNEFEQGNMSPTRIFLFLYNYQSIIDSKKNFSAYSIQGSIVSLWRDIKLLCTGLSDHFLQPSQPGANSASALMQVTMHYVPTAHLMQNHV